MRRLTRWGMALIVALLAIAAAPPGPAAAFDAAINGLTIVEDLELSDLTLEIVPELGQLVASEVATAGGYCSPSELIEDGRAYTTVATARLRITRKPQPRTNHRALEPPLHQRGIFD